MDSILYIMTFPWQKLASILTGQGAPGELYACSLLACSPVSDQGHDGGWSTRRKDPAPSMEQAPRPYKGGRGRSEGLAPSHPYSYRA